MSEIIKASELTKHFRLLRRHTGLLGPLRTLVDRQGRVVRAVEGVSFRVDAGELVGYIGPNGAGKSTTIKMLAGMLVPTSGELIVNGRVPWQERQVHVARIGAVFGQRSTLWWDLPVIETFELLQHIYRIPSSRFRRNLQDFSDLLELGPFLDSPVRSLSLGQRMRADLAAALLHDPDLLFLDEPTIGLDVVAKERIRAFISQQNRQRGVTVLLTTHDISDVEKLCERVIIIDRGRLLYDGSLSLLKEEFGGKRELQVEFAQPYPDVSLEGAELASHQGERAVYRFERGAASASDLISRLSSHYRIKDLSVVEPDIEDTIRRIYEERLLE
jgi:ABC-2 type transport system ATP-binding protein